MMIHPEIARYKNRPKVQIAIKAYREAFASAYTGREKEYGRAVKNAEYRVNEAIENEIAPSAR